MAADIEYSALDLFDMAREGQSDVMQWLPWRETILGVSLDGDGQIHAWGTHCTDRAVTLDANVIDVHDFEDHLDDLAERAP